MLTLRQHLFQSLALAPFLIGLWLPPIIADNNSQVVALGPVNIRIILEGENNEATNDSSDDLPINDSVIDDEMSHNPHIRLTPVKSPGADDQAIADRIVEEVRDAIAPYTDITVAEADGYLPFPPDPIGLRIVQYVNLSRAWEENLEFNLQEPGSLLYERQLDDSLRLVGAVFTAPNDATEAELNERVPLSITRWYQHVNICLPDPIWDVEQWAVEFLGRQRFGPNSAISTRAMCEAVGGNFWPKVFGWMVRVQVFADDPEDIWSTGY